MSPIILAISPDRMRRKRTAAAIWIAAVVLALVAMLQLRELAAARQMLAQAQEVRLLKHPAAGMLASPAAEELALARLIRAHADARFAGWSEAMTHLAEALPRGVTIERVTLNAKTGRGDATVRVARVEEVSRTVEALESARNFSVAAARRCEQGRTRDQAGMRCELGFHWTRLAP